MLNREKVVKYPLQDEVPQRRHAEDTVQQMARAVKYGASIYGVKKATPLINLAHFNIIDGFVPDSMHSIDLGIAKQYMEYWLNTSNMPYTIPKEYVEMIEEYLKN